ncbi:MAG TPA: penicillin-binding protein 1C, partial [Rhodocyclaceae bacterium]|nr:penicillin-binding protein 1C [Rhodocyclaceae bacterium]
RRIALPPPWLPTCRRHARQRSPEAGLKIVGASNGEILRILRHSDKNPAPLLRLQVRGHDGDVIWLVNGQASERRPARADFVRRLSEAGRYEITAMDDEGRFDRVAISVR